MDKHVSPDTTRKVAPDHSNGGTCLQPASVSYSNESEPLDGSSERLVIHPRPHFCSPFPHRGMRKIRKSILECCCLRTASHDDDNGVSCHNSRILRGCHLAIGNVGGIVGLCALCGFNGVN